MTTTKDAKVKETIRKSRPAIIAMICLLAAAGCVDLDTVDEQSSRTITLRQPVKVIPEFAIHGTEHLPESLYVTSLDLEIAEIRLAPLTGGNGLAYSTRDSMVLHYDVAAGETLQEGNPIELPEAGRYLVSIRLEPRQTEASFRMDGFVAGGAAPLADEEADEEDDGRPQPLPFEPGSGGTDDEELVDAQAFPTQWTAFQYQSSRSIWWTFSDLQFDHGTQRLAFSFDTRDWAVDVADPISKAVRHTITTVDGQSVDVSRTVDAHGQGADALIRTGEVQIHR